ncbi:MAG: phosphoribosylformylglycinamidine synthase, partial [Eubacteriales bacterium]
MLYTIFVEKKDEFAIEAKNLLSELRSFLSINSLSNLRIINRYYIENISNQLLESSMRTIFGEPQIDKISKKLSINDAVIFAVEYLPGQFDQRADSAMQCLQIISKDEKPIVTSAKIYALYGDLTDSEIEKIKNYVINPVEARLSDLKTPETIIAKYDAPKEVEILKDFTNLSDNDLNSMLVNLGLAMDLSDLKLCREYFKNENRQPTITEIRVIDTYWSDHCRHTTFNTIIENVEFEDTLIQKTYNDYLKTRDELQIKKPVTLMDIGTIVAKHLKQNGMLNNLDESDEINACTVKITVDVDGKNEPYLLLFKNETHNHPTEIEPFGGAATCVGGAIRDPLSGRSYVYGAIRLSGAANPLTAVNETLPGKLPQRKIVTGAASGYSSYGNQIGLATGIVDEFYHDGFKAKHMELGAVIAATPASKVKREKPENGDVVILLGGLTGRDGIGGATGSSKSHNINSVETCGAEVQKGNAPEERKIQRLFRNPELCKMVKKCNDFGAGGVCVAIGELADGLQINLNAIPKKYEGLDATELAISESQERMAVVIKKSDTDRFLEIATQENLRAVEVATVKDLPYLSMTYDDKYVVNIKREFLDSNGAKRYANIKTAKASLAKDEISDGFVKNYKNFTDNLNFCSKRGLSERFDSTIGSGAVMMPFGGKYQLTPVQSMVQKISIEKGDTSTCSLMSFGYNPIISEQSPYHGAYLAVTESVCKLIANGAKFENIHLSFQEYFEKMQDKYSWGKPLSALLGAYRAQMELKIAAIGGKDSMSGTFENIKVPPTLVSFAVTTEHIDNIVTPEFKSAGNKVAVLSPELGEDGLPKSKSLLELFDTITNMMREGKILSAYALGANSVAEAVFKMAIGNGFGFKFSEKLSVIDIFKKNFASFVVELSNDIETGTILGTITDEKTFTHKNETVKLNDLLDIYENKLEPVYNCNIVQNGKLLQTAGFNIKNFSTSTFKTAKPKVLIPIFSGTNCEYDSAKAFENAGSETE